SSQPASLSRLQRCEASLSTSEESASIADALRSDYGARRSAGHSCAVPSFRARSPECGGREPGSRSPVGHCHGRANRALAGESEASGKAEDAIGARPPYRNVQSTPYGGVRCARTLAGYAKEGADGHSYD